MKKTLVVSSPVWDLLFKVRSGAGTGSKSDCDIVESLGGSGFNVSRAFKPVGKGSLRICAIMAKDGFAGVLTTMIGKEFDNWRMATAAAANRISGIVPRLGCSGQNHIYTTRPEITEPDVVIEAVTEDIENGTDQVFLGSFNARDQPIVERLIEAAHNHGARVYFMPTTNQLRHREQFLSIVTGLSERDWLHFNSSDLKVLSGLEDIMEGVNWMRSGNVAASFVVTDGDNGLYCFHAPQQDWWFQKAFGVRISNDNAAGDTVAGTALGYLLRGSSTDAGGNGSGDEASLDVKAMLRYCAAAAAIHISGTKRRGGWDELDKFARTTPERTFERTKDQPVAQRLPVEWFLPFAKFTTSAAGASAGCFAFLVASILSS